MARKPKTNRVPRTRAGGTWTEAAYWGFLRSALRQASMRWPPLRNALKTSRRKYEGTRPLQKWEYHCAICGQWLIGKEVEVDHITPCGSLKSLDDLPGFVGRLFCEEDGLRVTCRACNQARNQKGKAA